MADRLTREQIDLRYQQKMVNALEGKEALMDVCGLGIEGLLAAIMEERDQLLRDQGYREQCERS